MKISFTSSLGSRFQDLCRSMGILLGLIIWCFVSSTLHADILIGAEDDGTNITFHFTGSVDLTGLTLDSTAPGFGPTVSLDTTVGISAFRFDPGASYDRYEFITPTFAEVGGTDFDLGAPDAISGVLFQIFSDSDIIDLPEGYESGDAISGSMTFNGNTFVSLDLLDSNLLLLPLPSGDEIRWVGRIVPPVLRITRPARSFRYRNRLAVRGSSSQLLSSLKAKWTGSRFKTIQLGGASSWRVNVPKGILRRKRAVTVSVRGEDPFGNSSSIVRRRYRRR